MLVARRDPPFDGDPRDETPYSHRPYSTARAPRLARFVTVIQMVGSVLAVPVGIASAYSFYRANFAPETTCQNLRSGIVAMLDKNVDVSTRRAIVRRDVETFEKSCGTVDPEATAAFKTLLEGEKAKAPATAVASPAPVAPKAQHSEPTSKEAVRKVEPRPQQAAKQAAPGAVANTDAAQRDPAAADTQWLDAVRQALVTHKPDNSTDKAEPRTTEPAKPQVATEPPARPAPAQRDAALPPAPALTPAPTPAPATPAASLSAPALPPAIAIAPPAPPPADADHPVPPGSIPQSASQADDVGVTKDEARPSRIRKWISEIPLLGPVVENGRQ